MNRKSFACLWFRHLEFAEQKKGIGEDILVGRKFGGDLCNEILAREIVEFLNQVETCVSWTIAIIKNLNTWFILGLNQQSIIWHIFPFVIIKWMPFLQSDEPR